MTAPTAPPYVRWWDVVPPNPGEAGYRLRSNDVPDVHVGGPPPPPPPGSSQSHLTGVRVFSTYTPGGATGRDLLILGVDMPTRANTGCTDRGILVETPATTYGGTADPANPLIVSNKWFTGRITVSSGYVDFKNCQGVGDPTGRQPVVQTTGAAVKRARFYDCDLWHQNPGSDAPAIKGWKTELYRCYVRGCTDGYSVIGIGKDGTNTAGTGANAGENYTGVDMGVVIHQSLFELQIYQSPDSSAAGGLTDNASHLDVGVQLRGGRTFDIRGNRFMGYYDPTIGEGGKPNVTTNAGTHVTGDKYATAGPTLDSTSDLMCAPTHGKISGFVLGDNWLAGARAVLNVGAHATTEYGVPADFQIVRNRVTLNHAGRPTGYWNLKASMPATINGNIVWVCDPWDRTDPQNPVYLPDDYGTVTTTAANQRTNG